LEEVAGRGSDSEQRPATSSNVH